ncbi:hypothetical protein [Leeia oryzae]|uniref:hypothetical protein n=1 Tax=Leeia oryzae TaxID=356662 RepID=UPI0012E9F9B5|nr:hypothetical protein [Leeia oryzae]
MEKRPTGNNASDQLRLSQQTLQHFTNLWGFPVLLQSVDDTGTATMEIRQLPQEIPY